MRVAHILRGLHERQARLHHGFLIDGGFMANRGLHRYSLYVGDTFMTTREGGDVPLVLVEAAPLDATSTAADAPFSLIFHSASSTLFPQDLYRLWHPVVGECEIFLVPVGRHESGFVYQAVFN
jgi:hypothetical protein